MTDDLLEKKTREAADAIWNQNGKHTHVNLDDIIRRALKEYGDARVEEVLNYLENEMPEISLHICRFNDAPQVCDCYYGAQNEVGQLIIKIVRVIELDHDDGTSLYPDGDQRIGFKRRELVAFIENTLLEHEKLIREEMARKLIAAFNNTYTHTTCSRSCSYREAHYASKEVMHAIKRDLLNPLITPDSEKGQLSDVHPLALCCMKCTHVVVSGLNGTRSCSNRYCECHLKSEEKKEPPQI